MKAIRTHLRSMALILTTLILLQGCTVYKSVPVTLEQAVSANTATKIKMINDRVIKYQKVMLENDTYYGLLHSRERVVKSPINENNIQEVKIKDKTGSAFLTWTIPALGVVWISIFAVASAN